MQKIMVAAFLVMALAGCTNNEAGTDELWTKAECTVDRPLPKEATMQTNMGDIRLSLHEYRAPITVANFVDLAESGYYDGVPFHRIIDDFMMQGGQGAPGVENIPDEIVPTLHHEAKGTLSMANAGPNTGSSQFFVTFGETAWLNGKHTVFGRTVEGFDVLDAVNANAKTSSPEEVVMETVAIRQPTADEITEDPFSFWTPNTALAGETGRAFEFITTLRNDGPVAVPYCLEAQSEEGLVAVVEAERTSGYIAPGEQLSILVQVQKEAATGGFDLVAKTIGTESRTSFSVADATYGKAAEDGLTIEFDVVGVTDDGRLFWTTLEDAALGAVARDSTFEGSFQMQPSYGPVAFQLSYPGLVKGFYDAALGLQEHESGASRFHWDLGYGEYNSNNRHALASQYLVFEIIPRVVP
ncbi:MAG: peptidylprolyl isomerase [Thermoplasmatota archaeon]